MSLNVSTWPNLPAGFRLSFRAELCHPKNMKNQNPKCIVCRGTVLIGEGNPRRAGRTVTHAGGCPQNSVRKSYVRMYTQDVLGVLNSPDASRKELADAIVNLGELVLTKWATRESCEKAMLSAKAFECMDRLEVEEILCAFLPEHSRC